MQIPVRIRRQSQDLGKTAKTIREIVKQRQIPTPRQDEDDEFVEAEEGEFSRDCSEVVNVAAS